MNDFLGREIRVGDTVVYPQRASSSLWMTAAEVVEVRPPNPEASPQPWRKDWGTLRVRPLKGAKLSTLTAVDRVVVVGRA